MRSQGSSEVPGGAEQGLGHVGQFGADMDWTGRRSKETPEVPGGPSQGFRYVGQFGADMNWTGKKSKGTPEVPDGAETGVGTCGAVWCRHVTGLLGH
jgi:hypothetical protein